jgi:hypothetical protein
MRNSDDSDPADSRTLRQFAPRREKGAVPRREKGLGRQVDIDTPGRTDTIKEDREKNHEPPQNPKKIDFLVSMAEK